MKLIFKLKGKNNQHFCEGVPERAAVSAVVVLYLLPVALGGAQQRLQQRLQRVGGGAFQIHLLARGLTCRDVGGRVPERSSWGASQEGEEDGQCERGEQAAGV